MMHHERDLELWPLVAICIGLSLGSAGRRCMAGHRAKLGRTHDARWRHLVLVTRWRHGGGHMRMVPAGARHMFRVHRPTRIAAAVAFVLSKVFHKREL